MMTTLHDALCRELQIKLQFEGRVETLNHKKKLAEIEEARRLTRKQINRTKHRLQDDLIGLRTRTMIFDKSVCRSNTNSSSYSTCKEIGVSADIGLSLYFRLFSRHAIKRLSARTPLFAQ